MEKMTYDYLPNTSIYLYQRKDMFRMNTDTALLGQFMKIKDNESVLDIGTNNGALLLYASLQTKGKLIGVDVQEEAIELARQNLMDNHIENFELIACDIQEADIEPVDVIVCNPPYFKVNDDKQTNVSLYKRIARHECYLTLEVLCACVSRLLKENGRFYLVHRSDRLTDICVLLREAGIEIKKVQFLRDIENENAHGILVEAVKGGKAHCTVLKEKIIQR